MTKRKIQYWVIPPKANGEFVAHMEDVLETYSKPYNPSIPVLCMDEQPIQLTQEIREPIRATKRHPRRVDYEYKRAGTASIFLFAEPLIGWRHVTARPRRTKIDWALEMAFLIEGRYANAEKVIVVCDNLNTHTKGAFYECFPADRARNIAGRIEFQKTPKHGSWLNVAENELSVMTGQCLTGRRISDLDTLRMELGAWAASANRNQRGVDWQFTIDNARIKLKSLYPHL